VKVLHISYSDTLGGAARCAYRIHSAICEYHPDIESKMLVVKKYTSDESVITIKPFNAWCRKLMGLIDRKFAKWFGAHDDFPVHTLGLLGGALNSAIKNFDPDVVHLHWVGNGVMSVSDVANLDRPIVWTLHDLWPLLGIRHYPEKFASEDVVSGVGEYISSPNWLSRWVYKQKYLKWYGSNITFVSQCEWSLEIAQRSLIGKGHKHGLIGCPIDSKIFRPRDQYSCRQKMNLNQDEKLILVGASGEVSTKNKLKGFKYFFEALRTFPKTIDNCPVRIVIIGANERTPDLPLPITSLGHIDDSAQLSEIYSAVDILVVPSLMETFGQSISESMSCGTPVVGFDLTSQRDLIEDGLTGYLAKFPDVDDLSKKMQLCLERAESMRSNVRSKSEKLWTMEKVISQYVEVYIQTSEDR